jgi:hypothetical protein
MRTDTLARKPSTVAPVAAVGSFPQTPQDDVDQARRGSLLLALVIGLGLTAWFGSAMLLALLWPL